jgi:chemotaxis signal transduction protein
VSDDEGVAALREALDSVSAAPPRSPAPDAVALLVIRAGGAPVAVRILELAGVLQARRVVPVPSRRAELLGICGIRGAVVPVYGLARLLHRADDPVAPRWMVLAGAGDGRVALAFEAIEGHVLVKAADLQRDAPGAYTGLTAEAVRREDGLTPLVSVPSILRAIASG